MTKPVPAAVALLAAAVFACSRGASAPAPAAQPVVAMRIPSGIRESHLANIRQLTNGGENAEAYFSRDGGLLIFQSTRDGRSCDQQYIMRSDGSSVHRVS